MNLKIISSNSERELTLNQVLDLLETVRKKYDQEGSGLPDTKDRFIDAVRRGKLLAISKIETEIEKLLKK